MADSMGLVDLETGLLSRDHFVRLAEREARRCERYGHPLAVVVLTVTGVTDDAPHDDGTVCDLRTVASTCAAGLREPDVLGYIGDGSFALRRAPVSWPTVWPRRLSGRWPTQRSGLAGPPFVPDPRFAATRRALCVVP